jgi:hypothetical protein
MSIDWYKKEKVISRIRLELTKQLEVTALYDSVSAKEKSTEIMQEILKALDVSK